MSILCHVMYIRLCLPVRLALPALLAQDCENPPSVQVSCWLRLLKTKPVYRTSFLLPKRWICFASGAAGTDSWGKDERVQKGDGTKLITKWPQRVFCKSCRKWDLQAHHLCYLMSCSESMRAVCVPSDPPSDPGKVACVDEILWRSSSSALVYPKQLCDCYLLRSVMSCSCFRHSPQTSAADNASRLLHKRALSSALLHGGGL